MHIRWSSGYTLIEVMIFLAVTGVLFLSATLAIGGQQGKVQFNQAMREVESKIRGVMNDATTGLFGNAGNIQCSVNGGGDAYLTPVGTDQTGKNVNCIFLGKALQFGVSGTDGTQKVRTYTVIGRRTMLSGSTTRDVRTIAEARPRVDTSIASYPSVETEDIRWGARVKNCTGNLSRIIVFTPTLAGADPVTGGNATGSQSLIPYTVPSTACIDQTNAINSIQTTAGYAAVNNANQWSVCFESADGRETALITIGINDRANDVKLEFVTC